MEDDNKDLRIVKYNLEMKKKRLQYKMDDYSDNSKTYNEQYIPLFILGLIAHLVFGPINDAGIAFIDLVSMAFMCGSGIAIILSNIFYTLPLISCKKDLKKMEKEIKKLECEIEKENMKDLVKDKEKEMIPKTEYNYDSKIVNNKDYQYEENNSNVVEQEKVKKLQLKKDTFIN